MHHILARTSGLPLGFLLASCAAVQVVNPSAVPSQFEVPPGLGAASYRVAPGVPLDPEMTEIEVLVTERACNSGEDAQGRILEPTIVGDGESVTVVFTVRPRAGGQDCPSNPETPFLLTLDEPLGARQLLDGSEDPARDATTCPETAGCAP